MVNADAVRGQVLLEESREAVVVLDAAGQVVVASRRARQSLGVREGDELGLELLQSERALIVPYRVEGSTSASSTSPRPATSPRTRSCARLHRRRLARAADAAGAAALTARARSPAGREHSGLVEQARREVDAIRELIDEVLFLAELESGTRVVSLGAEPVLPVLEEVAVELEEQAARAGVALRVVGDPEATAEVRPRMLGVVAKNLAENAIRYAGPGTNMTLAVHRESGATVLSVVDDGAGVEQSDLPRLFERFYRADRSRHTRGTGLGLAIVKHVVASAGGTEIEARGQRGQGLEIRCVFPGANPRRAS